MKNFTLKTLLFLFVLLIGGLANSQTTIDLSAIDNPYVLQDTLPDVPNGSILLLKPGMTYLDSMSYDFDKSLEFRSSDPSSDMMPRIDCKNNFNMADGADVQSIVFKNIHFENGEDGFDNRYVFNIDESATIGEIKFISCKIRSLRGITRLKDGEGTLGKYIVSDCIIDSINNYGVLYVDDAAWSAGDILLENSTITRTKYFLASRSNSNSLSIENCTLHGVPDVGRQIFRWRGGDGKNDITQGLTIKNTILGPGWDMEDELKTGVKGYEGLPNTSFTFENTWATADFAYSADTLHGLPNMVHQGLAQDLWVDPQNGDFNFKDLTFEGRYDSGDPRWRMENPNKVWNISTPQFNALGKLTETKVVDGLTIYASDDKSVTIDENNKSLDGMDFTHRLKLGGSGKFDDGMPVGRVLAFDVDGSTTITVIGMSSSSSSDRELVIAVDSASNELARFPALGSPISKGEYNYIGGPARILLFSPSSGVNVYYIKASPYIPDEQEWNISTDAFKDLGKMTSTVNVNGLSIHASDAKSVTVDENNKSLDGMDYTHRLKLGGSGNFDDNALPVGRVLSFKVNGSTNITVIGMSSSSSSDRILNIAAGHKDSIIATFPALGSSISKGEYYYKGDATTIYLYSPSSGVNLYHIKTAKVPTSLKMVDIPSFSIYPNPATSRVYIDVDKPMEIGIFNISGRMVINKRVESNRDAIDIAGISPGMYFVKSLDQKSKVQKLIVR